MKLFNFLKKIRISSNRLIALLLGCASCLAIFLWFPKAGVLNLTIAVLVLIAATVLSVWLLEKLIVKIPFLHDHSSTPRWMIGWGIFCLVAGGWLSINIPLEYPPAGYNSFASPLLIKMLYRLSTGVGIGIVLYLTTIWLATGSQKQKAIDKPSSRIPWLLKYALPIAIVWGIFLLAYFPGMMSADSMDQWGQMLSGRYIDHHPAFHTFLIWLLTRIYLSPAVIAVAQIIALAVVSGAWLAYFDELGIPRWIIWLTAAIFAISPVNGTMVNTLWKDIPYSIAIMGLSLILAKVVFSKGEWIKPFVKKVTLGVTLALILLFRHDGLPITIGILILLLFAYPSKWRAWLASGLFCAVLYLGIRGPVYQLMHVQKPTLLTVSTLSIYEMAAYSIPESEVDRLISSFELFPKHWDCKIWPQINPDWKNTDLDRSISTFQAAGNIAQHAINILLYDYRCNRSMEWVVYDPITRIKNTSHVGVLIDPNPYGIKPASVLPDLRDWITKVVVNTARDPEINWFFWRPAFFLYLNLFITAVHIFRYRNVRFGLISLPILIQAITFTLVMAEPNFRYHFAAFLVSLISIPLIICPPPEIKKTARRKT
jgi:hypothetical protein